MTRTRLLAALVMAPVAIAAILLLPTDWMMALAAVVFLLGLWEWFDLAEIEDTLARTVLLVAHLALMVVLIWASWSSDGRSEEHTSELQSLMRISYAVFCLKNKKIPTSNPTT